MLMGRILGLWNYNNCRGAVRGELPSGKAPATQEEARQEEEFPQLPILASCNYLLCHRVMRSGGKGSGGIAEELQGLFID